MSCTLYASKGLFLKASLLSNGRQGLEWLGSPYPQMHNMQNISVNQTTYEYSRLFVKQTQATSTPKQRAKFLLVA